MATIYHRQLPVGLTDPLLTALTVMLAVIMFVAAPLQAAGVFGAHEFGIAIGVVIIAAAVIISNSWLAVVPLALRTALLLWLPRLSKMTTSPGARVGTRTRWT